jgi:hypothetical protein
MMKHLKNRDVLSGLVFVVVGVFVALKAYFEYTLGTLSRMGPGYFPLMLGVVLALIGLVVIALSVNVKGLEVKVTFGMRAVMAVLLSALVFGFLVERLGLIPSALALTLIAAAAEQRYELRRSLVLGCFLGVLTWLIFVFGLEMNLSAFAWSF